MSAPAETSQRRKSAARDGPRRRRRTAPIRVAAVFPELTRERAPLLDRVAAHPELDLTAIYAGPAVAGRDPRPEPHHRAVFLRRLRLSGARTLADRFPLTLGVRRALASTSPDVVVVAGWRASVAQAAIAWCGLARVPYVLVVDGDDDARAGWRRRVDEAVVTPILQRARGVLVAGTRARRRMLEQGAPPEHVRVFADTIDVEDYGSRADALAGRRPELRDALGAGAGDVVVLSVGPLTTEKRHPELVHALAQAGDDQLLLVLAGDGPERERLEDLARIRGVRLVVAGDQAWEPIELYAAADVFALLSERETWVVVNEAAACGLPLLLTDSVGAAHDLLANGENGVLVEAGDVEGAASALHLLAEDPELRDRYGARSRELARDWGYGPSVDGFLAAVREAVAAAAADA
jgi:glycosyltransferase involved in cell wall biosynthesis